MNERIRELFLQSGFHPPVVKRMGDEYKFEKFAELIVKECARVITNGGYWTDILGNRKNASSDEIAQMIKQHFGVEE